jgi:hypothetical protein
LDKNNPSISDQSEKLLEHPSNNETGKKKLFVEPEISAPVDVLEATAFFQLGTSGATN